MSIQGVDHGEVTKKTNSELGLGSASSVATSCSLTEFKNQGECILAKAEVAWEFTLGIKTKGLQSHHWDARSDASNEDGHAPKWR